MAKGLDRTGFPHLNVAQMKTLLLPVVVLVAVTLSPAFSAYDPYVMVPKDFNRSLASHQDGELSTPEFTGVYKNSIGVVVNPNVRTRHKSVRFATRPVSPATLQLFSNSQGQELVGLAVDLARKTPGKAAEIATAAVRRNIETGGSPETDVAIARGIFEALGTAISVRDAAILIGLGTERLPLKQMDATVRQWRAAYLALFGYEKFGEMAKALDTQLVTTRIALAFVMSPEEFAALNTSDGKSSVPMEPEQGQQPETETSPMGTPIDTNPFFSGIPGASGISGGFGGGGGGGSSSTPKTPKTPDTPTPPAS